MLSQLSNQVGERSAGDPLHGDVVNSVLAAGAINRHDVRVLKRGGGLGFNLEPLEGEPIDRSDERKGLERDPPAQRKLLGSVNDAHPSASDLPEDLKVSEAGRWREALRTLDLDGRRTQTVRAVTDEI